jgi:predicted dehydrogenase
MKRNIGILGFAHGHVDAYCEAWRENETLGVRVTAGWDHDAPRARAACDRHGLERCESARELLGRSDVDGVVIASETVFHAGLVEQAASAGKSVVLQKPIALTMEEANRIVESVEGSGVPFTMAWQMRVDPQNVRMKELVESGVLGRIFMVRRRHGLPTQTWPDFEKSWHVQPELNRDIFADDAAHAIDFLYWLLGMPKSVTAEIGSLLNPNIPSDNAIVVFRYADGAFAEASCSFTCVAAENTTEIIGEKGTIIQNYGDVPSANVPRPGNAAGLKWRLQETGEWTESDIPSPPDHGYRIRALASPLAEFLLGRRDPIATADEGRTVLRLVLACYESSREGRRIALA